MLTIAVHQELHDGEVGRRIFCYGVKKRPQISTYPHFQYIWKTFRFNKCFESFPEILMMIHQFFWIFEYWNFVYISLFYLNLMMREINICFWPVFGERCQTEILVANAIRCESPIRPPRVVSQQFQPFFVSCCFLKKPKQEGEKIGAFCLWG